MLSNNIPNVYDFNTPYVYDLGWITNRCSENEAVLLPLDSSRGGPKRAAEIAPIHSLRASTRGQAMRERASERRNPAPRTRVS